MIRATSADVGRKVIFRLYRGAPGEIGVIASVKGQWVMVKYNLDPTPLPTRPEALEWLDNPVTAHDVGSTYKKPGN